MENKTTSKLRNVNNKSDSGLTESESVKSDNTDIKNASIKNTSEVDTSTVDDQEFTPEDIRAIEIEELKELAAESGASVLYHKAIKDFDPNETNVQIAEFIVFRDKEYDEHGYF